MRLKALKTHIDRCLSAKRPPKDKRSKNAAGPIPYTWAWLHRRLGFNKSSVWRKLRAAPWEYHKRDNQFYTRLATAIGDNREKLLWLGGYNPLVKHRLSPRELYLLWELMSRVVYMLKDGTLTPSSLSESVAINELAELSKKR